MQYFFAPFIVLIIFVLIMMIVWIVKGRSVSRSLIYYLYFIGFISGIVGIGGGIFLSPMLLLLNIDKAKNIITGASIFIVLNSLSGIMGQITKNNIISELLNFWPLFLMVIIGGQIGNFLNLKILSSKILTLITSALVLFVSVRIGYRIFF